MLLTFETSYLTKIIELSKKEIVLEVEQKNEDIYSLNVNIDIALGILKNDKMNLAIQKLTEIGIRKINGARTLNILWLLIKPMFLWMAVGFAIAAPLAWLFMERWLQQFVYRVDISITPFIIAILIVAITTMLTVGWHVWRTARANPSESLKSE